MKRRILSIFCVLALCLGLLLVTALADEPTGNWTDSNNYNITWYTGTATTYNISDAADLAGLAVLVNGLDGHSATDFSGVTITLADNIDLSGHYWSPIGTSTSNYFKGTFDGDGHTISNLTIDTNASYVGLFGATSGAKLKNVTLDRPQVKNSAGGTSNTGALVGFMAGSGTTEYCAVTNGSVSSDGQYVGGLIGNILGGTAQYCYNYETTVISTNDTQTYVNGVAGRTGNYTYLCSSFSYVSNQKELKASNTANYAAYLSDTPTERAYGINGGQHGFTAEQFRDGTVAYFLRTGFYSGVSYGGWGQTLGTDTLPEWNGEEVESLKYAHLGDTGTAVDAYAYFNALTPDDGGTYHIKDTSDWIAFVKLVKEDNGYDADAVVEKDAVIDFSQFGMLTNKSTYSYLVIADKDSGLSYTGTFTGNGCTVKGVSYSGAMEFALFGTIGEGGSVSGITLEEPKISGTTAGAYNIAGIASHNYGTIENCHLNGGAISTVATTAAGIAAESFGTVSNCTNSADITAKYEVAGIVATSNSTNENTSATNRMVIEGCSNSGTITATYAGSSHAGGIFGGQYQFSNRGYPYGTISKCFNTGNILGQSYIGGIVGYSIKNANASAANVTIENCYNTGAIGDDRTTGVAGGISAGTNSSVTNCFNMGDVTGTNAQPIVANGQGVQAWSVNSYASCEVNGPTSGYLYYGADNGVHPGPKDEQGRYCLGSGKRTDAEMASGEVAYLLQQEQENGEQVWSQQIGVDDHPVLVINGEPAPVVLITVKLVDDGGTATELTKCYTNAGSTLSAYPTPDDPGAVYTFYEDSDCKTIINTAEKTYDGDTTIYAKQSQLPELVGTVTIEGTPKTGEKLTADTSVTSDNPGTLSYQWYRCEDDQGIDDTKIADATGSTYTVTKADTGKYIKVVVTAANYSGSLSAVTSQVQENPAMVSEKPAANNNLVYSGSDQELVTAGTATGGEMQYSTDGNSYSTDIPTGTEAKTYTVWYYVKGDKNHSDTAPQQLTVEIGKAPRTIEAPTQSSVTTTSVTLNAATVSAGADDGKVEYGYSTSQGAQPAEWQTALTFNNLTSDTTYYFFAQVTGGKNYMDVTSSGTKITTDSKTVKKIEVTAQPNKLTYTVGEVLDLTGLKIKVTYSDDTTGEKSWGDEGITANPTNATTLTAEDNGKAVTITYGGKTAQTASLTVNKGSFTATVTMRDYAKGQTPSTPSVSSNPGNGNVTYYYSTSATASDGTEWTIDIGKTLAVGTYYMYAVIDATDLYNSCTTSATQFKVTEAAPSVVPPTAKTLTYTGEPQDLIEPGSIEGGTMVYSLSKDGEYSKAIPTGTDAGYYTVWYKAAGDTQASGSVSVQIKQAVIVSFDIPEDYYLEALYTNAKAVQELLASEFDPATGRTADGTEIEIKITGWDYDIYINTRPSAVNEFEWWISQSNPNMDNYTLADSLLDGQSFASGTIDVHNLPNVTINFDANGGSVQPTSTTTVNYKLASLPIPSRSGYVFDGWFTQETDGEEVTTDTVFIADTTIYAHWSYAPTPVSPSYRVTVEDTKNGEVASSHSWAVPGVTVTLTVSPGEGYELASLSITKNNGDEVKFTDMGNGKFTFTMPASNVKVTTVFRTAYDACPRDETCPIWHFTDASTTAWYHDGVHYCLANGLMEGVSDTLFAPNASMTRAMVWAILARLDGETITGSNWAETARAWAMENGVSDGTDPMSAVTREQLVTMLWRYAGSETPTGSLTRYPDYAAISDWAGQAMLWATVEGIIEGDKNGLINPTATATRAQAATILVRFCEG